jgi:hypothetical protein
MAGAKRTGSHTFSLSDARFGVSHPHNPHVRHACFGGPLLFKRPLSVLLSGSILNQFLFPAPRSSYTWDSFPVRADDEHPVKVSSDSDVHAYKVSERPAVTVAEHGMQQGELVCVVGREGNIVPCTLMPGAKIGIQTLWLLLHLMPNGSTLCPQPRQYWNLTKIAADGIILHFPYDGRAICWQQALRTSRGTSHVSSNLLPR